MGKIATNILASGNGWSAGDVVRNYGPRDQPFEEQHGSISISVVVKGSFQYRSAYGSEVMSPGSLLLGNLGQRFECGQSNFNHAFRAEFGVSPTRFRSKTSSGNSLTTSDSG